MYQLAMFNIGYHEMLLVLVIALIVFGPKKLPEIGRSLGKGLRELKRASNELMSSVQEPFEEEETEDKTRQKEGEC
ncbi:MAG TPA: TatA/E family twin arginine-targeting protein translocase [Armatimonadota bacterium]|nr:TatA/E family twin arginine-targeting protein translocase [Armatimonadota bacterium]HOP80547.1 TatA/E family twin arginine-targeting protein translocase [Armatimonadota bacterium]HPP75764.1 TatA/E family twin arginine-targeting protein translocase [Armatimonadota bacterium]